MNQVPPHNIQVEQAVLCSCILNNEALRETVSQLQPGDFYKTIHQIIFKSILSLHKQKEPVELITLTSQLQQDGNLEKIGGAVFLNRLTDEIPVATNIKSYCKIVKENAAKRRHIEIANAIAKKCYADEPLDQINEYADQSLNQLKSLTKEKKIDIYDSKRMLKEFKKYIKSLRDNRFITGINEIDNRIRGVAGGEVLTIIARAGSFKTAILQNMLKNYVQNSSWGAAFFSLEMPVASLTERYISILEENTGKQIESFYKSESEYSDDIAEMEKRFINSMKNLFVIPAKVSLKEIKSYTQLIEREYGLKMGVIGIDYLGLIDGKGQNEYEAVSRVARGTKDLAKSLNLPVILVSQVSRKGGEGEIEISLDMGRGSGAIEEAADFVLGLWQVEHSTVVVGMPDEITQYDLICRILKNRKGARGSRWKLELDAECFIIGKEAQAYNPPKKTGKSVDI
ncbi:MAG: hypothetical protein JSW07_04810 [bacterium]|nr:MAG: hypothetical protein JSW07_04810 [bacterium]